MKKIIGIILTGVVVLGVFNISPNNNVKSLEDFEENEKNQSRFIESSIITEDGEVSVIEDEDGKINTDEPSTKNSPRSTIPASGFIDTSSLNTSSTITVYSDSGLSNAYTYYNPGSSNVVVYFNSTSTALQININGYTGWIARSTSYSYLSVSDAINKGYISTFTKNSSGDLTMSYRYYGSSSTIIVGKAPDFLTTGSKYYSPDGIYFYQYVTPMMNDLKSSTNSSAINAGSPYYNYYQFLPFKSSTNLTNADLKNYITNRGYNSATSILARDEVVNAFFDGQKTLSINAALEFSMAILESGYGTSQIAMNKNNLFGWGAYDSNPYAGAFSFPTAKEGVLYHMENAIDDGYLDNLTDNRYFGSSVGNKLTGVNVKYASDPFWGLKIAGIYYSIDKASGFKDYNYYTLGMVNKTNSTVGMYYNGNFVYNFKNTYSNINPSYQPVLILSKSGSSYNVISDTSIYNSGDNVEAVTIKNDVITRYTYGTPVLNSAHANAQTSFDKDIVSFNYSNVTLFGGSSYNKPSSNANDFSGYTKVSLENKAVVLTSSGKAIYGGKPNSTNKVGDALNG
ncbi:MAG: glucosaminidase domain-containing protein, partial [Bacilli bacterium]